nr:hypothetical protein [Halomonas sp.]
MRCPLLLGKISASGPDHVGVEFADGRVSGNQHYIKLRFPTTYMEQAAEW